ncbi:MAG: hypothetical protein QM689_11565 [Oscillospiraceae bacterium]
MPRVPALSERDIDAELFSFRGVSLSRIFIREFGWYHGILSSHGLQFAGFAEAGFFY